MKTTRESTSGLIRDSLEEVARSGVKGSSLLDEDAILHDNDPFIDYDEELEFDERLLRREGMRSGKHT